VIDLFWSISPKIFEPSKCNLAARPMLRPSSEGWMIFLLPSPMLLLLLLLLPPPLLLQPLHTVQKYYVKDSMRWNGTQWDASSMEKN